jgi:small-conductance mechanosensitive channel/CRP-like cAMP-binding protein
MRDFFFLLLTAALGMIYSFLRSQPDLVGEAALQLVWVAVLIAASIFLVRMLSRLFIDILFPFSHGTQPSELLRLLVSAILYGVAGMLILRFAFNEDLLAVVTASAVITAVLGFALQDTLANLFSGVAMQVEQPFQSGDIIRLGNIVGTVEALTWRSVSLRTFDNTVVVVPNNHVSDEPVEVMPAGLAVESQVTFPAPISIPPQKVIEIVNEAVRAIPNVSERHHPETRILDFDNTSLRASVIYETTYFLEDYSEVEETDGVVRKWIWYTLLRDGIEMIDGPLPAFRVEPALPAPVHEHYAAIASNPIFRGLHADEQEFVADRLLRPAFASGEPVILKGDSRYSMFIVAEGGIRVQLTKADDVRELVAAGSDFAEGNGDGSVSRWDPDVLDEVTHQLADHIGPIARLLVNRAAGKTIDPYRLYRMLAEEVDDPDRRAAFLAGAPPLPVAVLEKGDSFGEMSLFTGEPPVATRMEAVGQTELLEIRVSVVAELLSRNNHLASVFSDNLVAHQAYSLQSLLDPQAPADAGTILERIKVFYEITDA